MICEECGKKLTNEDDCYGHDCEVIIIKPKLYGCINDGSLCQYMGFGIDYRRWNGIHNWCHKKGKCKFKKLMR